MALIAAEENYSPNCEYQMFHFSFDQDEFYELLKQALREVLHESDFTPQPHLQSDLMDVQEAASFLKISVHTLYSRTCNRTIPFYKQGRRLVFDREELRAWVKGEGPTPTKAKIRELTPSKHGKAAG